MGYVGPRVLSLLCLQDRLALVQSVIGVLGLVLARFELQAAFAADGKLVRISVIAMNYGVV